MKSLLLLGSAMNMMPEEGVQWWKSEVTDAARLSDEFDDFLMDRVGIRRMKTPEN